MTAPLDPTYDPLREYDTAVVQKLGAQVVTPAGARPYYAVAVPGISGAVHVNVGLPEDWYKNFSLPAVNVRRGAILPAPSRLLPNFRARERSTNPETPNTWNVQAVPPQPVNILYEVELAATSEAHMNRLTTYLMAAVPASHWGTFLTVFGTFTNYHGTGMRDKTDYATKDGRQFLYCFDYTVEGWFVPSLACEKVPEILSTDIALETHRSRDDLRGQTPVEETEAVEVIHIHTNAPE